MKQKMILHLVAGAMLIISVLAVAPITEAAYPHTVKGTLYIYDGDSTYIAEAGIGIEFEFLDGTESTTTYTYDTYGDSTNYNKGFFGHDSESVQPGLITVIYKGYELTPIDNPSITINETPGYFMDLTIDISDLNSAPDTPILVSPLDGATNIATKPTLKVSVSDNEGDSMTVRFYDASDDSVIKTNTGVSNGTTSATWSGRAYSSTYSWYAIASDSFGSSQSDTWSFTTKAESQSPPDDDGGGSSGGGGGFVNSPPNADAGGPYFGTEGEVITFDGSGSSDPEGKALEFRWDFEDDGTYDTDWSSSSSVTHIYLNDGDFKVKLQVRDDLDAKDTDTADVAISQFNNPPTTPVVSGPQTGDVDTDYEYTAVSTDLDNDTIQYMITWGDTTNTTTAFVADGMDVTETHSWSSYGFYIVAVTAYDDQGASSGTKELVVAIDVIWVQDIGYLIDSNSDGTYNLFYSNETDAQTDTEKQTDGTYLINSDEDEEWDWEYDSETDTLTEYKVAAEEEADYTWLYALLIIIIILLIIGGAAAGRKKKTPPKSKNTKNTKNTKNSKNTKNTKK